MMPPEFRMTVFQAMTEEQKQKAAELLLRSLEIFNEQQEASLVLGQEQLRRMRAETDFQFDGVLPSTEE